MNSALPQAQDSVRGSRDRAHWRELLTRPNRLYRLSYYFLMVSIPTGLAAILATVWMYRTVVLDDLELNIEQSDVVLLNSIQSLLSPHLSPLPVPGGENTPSVAPAADQDLNATDQAVRKLMAGTTVVKLRLFDVQGTTRYSTERAQIGETSTAEQLAYLPVSGNRAMISVKWNPHFYTGMETLDNRYILSSFLPLADREGQVAGVLEIYHDVSVNYQRVQATQVKFLLALAAVGILSYAILFSVIFHSDQLIVRQSKERESHLKQLRKINRELEIARDRETGANIAKSQFLANMSHELRTPLNAIIGYSEMLAEDVRGEFIDLNLKDLQQIQVAGKHLLALIDEVLDLSKVEAGKMDLTYDTFSLVGFVDGIVALMRPAARKNNTELRVSIQSGVQDVTLDQAKLQQILLNLLSNAVKFTRDGEIRMQVYQDHSANTDWIVFLIRDSGIGMPTHVLEKIFEPFTQADSSSTRRFGGTGLGLAITQRFCLMMGGSITVCSQDGEGSTFVVRLPLHAKLPAKPAAGALATAASNATMPEIQRESLMVGGA